MSITHPTSPPSKEEKGEEEGTKVDRLSECRKKIYY